MRWGDGNRVSAVSPLPLQHLSLRGEDDTWCGRRDCIPCCEIASRSSARIDNGTLVEVGLVLIWLDGDAEVEVCVEGLDVFGSVGFCFVGDEDGVVGCGVDGRGDGGDGGRAAEDLPPLPRRCREERDKTRGDTM